MILIPDFGKSKLFNKIHLRSREEKQGRETGKTSRKEKLGRETGKRSKEEKQGREAGKRSREEKQERETGMRSREEKHNSHFFHIPMGENCIKIS